MGAQSTSAAANPFTQAGIPSLSDLPFVRLSNLKRDFQLIGVYSVTLSAPLLHRFRPTGMATTYVLLLIRWNVLLIISCSLPLVLHPLQTLFKPAWPVSQTAPSAKQFLPRRTSSNSRQLSKATKTPASKQEAPSVSTFRLSWRLLAPAEAVQLALRPA